MDKPGIIHNHKENKIRLLPGWIKPKSQGHGVSEATWLTHPQAGLQRRPGERTQALSQEPSTEDLEVGGVEE